MTRALILIASGLLIIHDHSYQKCSAFHTCFAQMEDGNQDKEKISVISALESTTDADCLRRKDYGGSMRSRIMKS